MFETISIAERTRLAKEKTARVVDHLLYVLELHENNAIILYSPTLSAQIPTSFAANAFNVFQRGLHQFEIVRLCALWDRAEIEKENIPTVIELVDNPDVIEGLAQDAASHWSGIGGRFLNPSEDPQIHALEIEALQQSNEAFGAEQAQKAKKELRKATDTVRSIMRSTTFSSLMNLRDKHLAHSLSKTRREHKVGALPPMKYGDERELLNASVSIVETLYCWVNGISFSFEDSREIDKKNAKALWESCTFQITE
jgi:hypothetical protein